MPISDKVAEYAAKLQDQLFDANVRVTTDVRNEKIGYKIRQAQVEHVPYMLVVGEKEAQSGQVAVRSRDEGDLGVMDLASFLQHAQK